MPTIDNPMPFIKFENAGNAGYVPVFREGGLTPEIINSGNLQVLRNFFNERANTLNRDEIEYLTSRIVAAEEFEKIGNKARRDLAEGKDHPVMQTDKVNDFTGFSSLTYPGHQTSANGCWSCAYSLLLKSRGVELSQEKIRAWRPDYAPTEDGSTPAAQNMWYMRNADTAMELPVNADMLSQLVPNTAMVSFTIPILFHETITLTDPKTGLPVKRTPAQISDIRDNFKSEVIRTLNETITNAVKVDHSPVAIVVDGHYITVTGIDDKGNIRYEDSVYEQGNTTHYMTLEQLYHIGHEVHEKQVDANTVVNVEPMGIALNWVQDLKVPEYNSEKVSKPDYKENNDVITVDEQGNVTVDIPADDKFRTKGGNITEGNVNTQTVMKLALCDKTALEKKLGLKATGLGPDGSLSLGNYDIYYPSKVCAKNDPKLALAFSLAGDKQIRAFADDLLGFAHNGFAGKPWAADLEKYASDIMLLTKTKVSDKDRKKAEDSLKAFPAFLSQMDGEKTVLKTLFDNGCAFDNWEDKGKFIGDLNHLNEKLGLGMDVAKAMSKQEGTVYTQGDAKTDAEIDYYMHYLDPEKITSGKVERISAVDSLASLIALMQLRKDKYASLHSYPPKSSEITALKNNLANTAAMDEIKSMGIENFLASGNTPSELYESFMTVNRAIYSKTMGNIAANDNKVQSVYNINEIDDNFTLFGNDEPQASDKNTALKKQLGIIDKAGCGLFPEQKGNDLNDAQIIEGAQAPDAKLAALRRTLINGKNAKVSKKAYTAILNALDDYINSYKIWKNVKANPCADIDEQQLGNGPYDMEMYRYEELSDTIAAVQEKNKVLADTINKYIAESAGKKGNDEYKLVLESVKAAADDARIYMDDMQMQNDLDHVNNLKLADLEVIREQVNNERAEIEESMLRASSDRDKLFLFNKSEALFNISEIALKNADNTLSEDEKQLVSTSVGNLLFDNICEKFPDMKNKVNSPETQQQYDEAVMDIVTSASFADLIRDMDRESLRHIIAEKNGSEDLYKNFIKQEYLSTDEISKLSSKKAPKQAQASNELHAATPKGPVK